MLNRLREALTGARARRERGLDFRERTIRGLQVGVTETKEYGWRGIFAGLEGALDLIAEHDPVWLRRMKGDVAEIRVLRYPLCRAAFLPDTRIMILDSYFVSTFPPAAVASSIVHEATHARLTSGAPAIPYGADPARHERICRRAEIRFGGRLPEAVGAAVIERAAVAEAGSDAEVAPLAHPDPE